VIIVNPWVAAELEKVFGWVRDRDFLVTEPLPAEPLDLAAMSDRLNGRA
jgi:hypothetical protein